jgi:hypothetical protein
MNTKINSTSDKERLARECTKLDPLEEKMMAEEYLSAEIDIWRKNKSEYSIDNSEQ